MYPWKGWPQRKYQLSHPPSGGPSSEYMQSAEASPQHNQNLHHLWVHRALSGHEILGHQPSLQMGILPKNLKSWNKEVPIFCSTCQRIPYVINCLRPEVLPATVPSHRLQIIHGVLYIYYTISCAVWFQVSTDTNNGLFLIYIQGTVEGEMSVTALECCKNSLVQWLSTEMAVLGRHSNYIFG